MARGPSTRAVHAGLPAAEQGAPLLPGPVLAAPYHLRGDSDAAAYGYARDGNPTWSVVEAALGALDDAESVLFSSGMAALCAVLEPALGRRRRAGGGARRLPGRARGRDRPARAARRRGAVRADRHRGDRRGLRRATLVWIETPSNPRLDICDIAAVAGAAHAAGARLAVDNTLATPLGQRPLDHGADAVMYSATKALSGHSDLVLGAVAVRDPEWAAALRGHARRAARSPARSRPGCCSARCRRSHCGWRARARTRWRWRGCCARTGTWRTSATRGSRTIPARARRAPDAPHGPARLLHARERRARPALPRRARAGRRGDELRRRALERRAARRAGPPTTSPRASSASPQAARTRRTCSPTSSRRSPRAERPAAGRASQFTRGGAGPGGQVDRCAGLRHPCRGAARRGLEGPCRGRGQA